MGVSILSLTRRRLLLIGAVALVFTGIISVITPALHDKALAATLPALAALGLIYLEAATAWDEAKLSAYGLSLLRHMRAGAVHAHLLRRTA